jgi:predicted HicB family RNase H-like nuclease
VSAKDLNYYLNLDYDVVIARLEADGDVVYKAYSRDLDSFVFYGSGDTKAEALASFEATKYELFQLYLEEGREIPEPTRESRNLPSGRFLLRIDPKVHYRLVHLAKLAEKSLNSYIDQVLVEHVTGEDILRKCSRIMQTWRPNQYRALNAHGLIAEAPNPDYQQYSTEETSVLRVA